MTMLICRVGVAAMCCESLSLQTKGPNTVYQCQRCAVVCKSRIYADHSFYAMRPWLMMIPCCYPYRNQPWSREYARAPSRYQSVPTRQVRIPCLLETSPSVIRWRRRNANAVQKISKDEVMQLGRREMVNEWMSCGTITAHLQRMNNGGYPPSAFRDMSGNEKSV